MSTPRSVSVKRRLSAMITARFPDFLFTYEWQNTGIPAASTITC